jgi:hypothetical protein
LRGGQDTDLFPNVIDLFHGTRLQARKMGTER